MTRTGRRPTAFARSYTEPRRQYACTDKDHRPAWAVMMRNANYSAFNGYHYTPSDYSLVRCGTCGLHWRTKAAYVATLPDAPRNER